MELVEPQEQVEAAQLALMRERLGARDIIGGGAGQLGGGENPFGRDIEERRFGIDKGADQPGASDAVDLRPLSRDPAALARRQLLAQWQPEFGPSGDAAFEIADINSGAAQRDRGLLANLMAVYAIHDHRSVGAQLVAPF